MAVINRYAYPGAFSGEFGYYAMKANVTEGVPMMRETATNVAGEVIPVTTTSAANLVGLNLDTKTYENTQATLATQAYAFPINTANMARIVRDPFAIYNFRISGTAADGGALAGSVCVVNNTVASAGGTLVTGAVGTVDRSGGTIIGLTGANKGIHRRISAWVSATSVTVATPFPYAIAVGDDFVIVPISKASQALTLCTAFTEVNGLAAVNAGGEWSVVGIAFDLSDEAAPVAEVECMAGAHMFNRLS